MIIQGLIFDLDGTLADTMNICVQSLQETITQYTGRPLAEEDLYAHFGPSEEGILHAVLGERGPSAYSHFLRIYERLHQNGRQIVFPGVVEMLETLRGMGLRLAIATGKAAETAEISLRYSGLEAYVERVETGFIDAGNKPLLIERILAGWKMPPARAAYVGDALSDMHAARQAGVCALGAAWAEESPLRAPGLPVDWVVFRRVGELAEWVGQRR